MICYALKHYEPTKSTLQFDLNKLTKGVFYLADNYQVYPLCKSFVCFLCSEMKKKEKKSMPYFSDILKSESLIQLQVNLENKKCLFRELWVPKILSQIRFNL